jgi:hypothetical protein
MSIRAITSTIAWKLILGWRSLKESEVRPGGGKNGVFFEKWKN